MKRPSVEDVIIWGCVLFTLMVMLWLMIGCSTKQTSADVLWHSGNCVLAVEGLSIEQADDILRTWDFKECEVNTKATQAHDGDKE